MESSILINADNAIEALKLQYTGIIKEVIPDLEEEYYMLPLEQARVDSIDLITIRTELEKFNGSDIPDDKWLNFKSLDEMIAYCAQAHYHTNSKKKNSKETSGKYQIAVNMPQMAISALSESWLFKELGHRHWEMLCQGLATHSGDIADGENNRLYATFVRVNFLGSSSLAAFEENDIMQVEEEIYRYGTGIYLSRISLSSPQSDVVCRLMTSFSLRNNGDNTRLTKSQPFTSQNNIALVSDEPQFINEYRNMKKGVLRQVSVGNELFYIIDDIIFETEYGIAPYHDLNGVGLLYFAAYPIINDICEARYFNAQRDGGERWEMKWSTRDRDIFYYGNCNPNDTLVYQLHTAEFFGDCVKTYSSLIRKKDGVRIAQIFTVKSVRG